MSRVGGQIGTMTVRFATPADAAAVEAIVEAAPVPRGVHADQYASEFETADHADGTGHWVAEEAGTVVGYIELGTPQDDVPALEVSVYLHPDSTAVGRGAALLNEFAKPVARAAHARVLTGTPHTDVSVKLLEKCGFTLRHDGTAPKGSLEAQLQDSMDKKNRPFDFHL